MRRRNRHFGLILIATTAVVLVASTAQASRRTAAPIEFKVPATVPGEQARIVDMADERSVTDSHVHVTSLSTGVRSEIPYYHRTKLLGAPETTERRIFSAALPRLFDKDNRDDYYGRNAETKNDVLSEYNRLKNYQSSDRVVTADQVRPEDLPADQSTLNLRQFGFDSDGEFVQDESQYSQNVPQQDLYEQDQYQYTTPQNKPLREDYSGPVVGASYPDQLRQQQNIESNYVYFVRRGDTLYSLARNTGSSVEELSRLNGISAPYALQVGQRIALISPFQGAVTSTNESYPSSMYQPVDNRSSAPILQQNPQYHEVRSKDTLFSLAKRYNADLDELASVNNISWPYTLNIGDRLRIPGTTESYVDQSFVQPGEKSIDKAVQMAQSEPKIPQEKQTQMAFANIDPELATGGVPITTIEQPVLGPTDLSNRSYSATQAYNHSLDWPVDDGIIIGRFNEHQEANMRLATDVGAPVKSVAFGKVTYAGRGEASYAKRVVIQHDHGLITIYDRLDNLQVKKGQIVTQGTVIGETWGRDPKMETIFEFAVKQNNRLTDPSKILKKRS